MMFNIVLQQQFVNTNGCEIIAKQYVKYGSARGFEPSK